MPPIIVTLSPDVEAAAQGASFDHLAAAMREHLKRNDIGPDRLLIQMERDGLVVHEDDRYRLSPDLDPELAGALRYLSVLRD